MMIVFLIIVVFHWLEHLVQLGQVAAGVHRHCASGFLGYFFPALVRNESLHFGYAVFMFVGLGLLRSRFAAKGWRWETNHWKGFWWPKAGYNMWMLAFYLQAWHLFEHTLLFVQVNFLGVADPISVLQWALPAMRIELHLFYNTIVTIPMVIALAQRGASQSWPILSPSWVADLRVWLRQSMPPPKASTRLSSSAPSSEGKRLRRRES